jgi:hypothetical protein
VRVSGAYDPAFGPARARECTYRHVALTVAQCIAVA